VDAGPRREDRPTLVKTLSGVSMEEVNILTARAVPSTSPAST
jgi:hypothetical protein